MRRSPIRRTVVGALLVATTWSALTFTASASTATTATKSCGSFTDTYTYDVSRSGDITCRFAMRIVRSFILNHSGWRKHSIDDTLAGTYYTSRRFRGWRCSEGSGGGSCYKTRDRRTAAGYQSRPG